MKSLKDMINAPVNEGWAGSKGNKAYDEMVEAFSNASADTIVTALWNYFSSNDLEDFYEFLKDEEIIY